LIRAEQTVGSINELLSSNKPTQAYKIQTVLSTRDNILKPSLSQCVAPIRRIGRAPGRTLNEKLKNDVECSKCKLWFFKGGSIAAHNKFNKNKAICVNEI
jgi:hypothetical protein